jgi:hypothetical protein
MDLELDQAGAYHRKGRASVSYSSSFTEDRKRVEEKKVWGTTDTMRLRYERKGKEEN